MPADVLERYVDAMRLRVDGNGVCVRSPNLTDGKKLPTV
jgi:hypothetical protein